MALVFLWLTTAVFVRASLGQNDGHLVYPLDDTYIAMAMAKNLAVHGVLGITRHEFTSSSSSIAWPLLIAATFGVTGTNDFVPLVWNLLFATLVVVCAHHHLSLRGPGPGYLAAALLAIVLLTPLPTLTVIGLEHTLHSLLTLAVVGRAAHELSEHGARYPAGLSPWLLLLVVGLVSARYEGLFLAAILCLFFGVRRGWRSSALVGVAAALPVSVYGIVSLAHGWHFLPNPILIKGALLRTLRQIFEGGLFSWAGATGVFQLLGYGAYLRFVEAPHVLFVLLLLLVLYMVRHPDRSTLWTPAPLMVALFAGTALLHMQFAAVGWFFRYESYLVGLGLFVLAFVLAECVPWTTGSWAVPRVVVVSIVALLSTYALLGRAKDAVRRTPQAMRNIYEQQYQMGLFLSGYPQGTKVTAQDVGAINYLADLRCVDANGLATRDSFDVILDGTLTPEALALLSRNSKLVVGYERIFAFWGIPAEWVKVGSWTISNNVVCGDATVSFYSTEGGDPLDLASKLKRFGPRLPADIQQLFHLDPSGATSR